jgi:hypothetical protein
MVRSALVALLVLAGSQSASAGFYYGDDLQSFCRAEVASPYVLGVYDAWEFAKFAGAEGADICLPANVRGQQLVDAACEYVDGLDPESARSSAGLIVLAGLTEAFPCS